MKNCLKTYLILSVIFLFFGSSVFASFPVKTVDNKTSDKTEASINKITFNQESEPKINSTQSSELDKTISESAKSDNDMLILVLLWVFLGGLAVHRFYARKPWGWNFLFIITGGGLLIWAIIDLINILRGNFMMNENNYF